ncbi:MAG: hypothetical protein GC168_19425 [Candidatus Hydrogenedens sp.]|nr:hypothetical protein [Candidatus Hydrogenedens sp.]
MDPNLIHVDWERTFEALTLIIILSFIVERALAVLFENKVFILYLDRDGLKELIAVGVGIAVCAQWKFDALGMLLLTETTTMPGYILTGLVIAGGSKASIKLFHDVLGAKTTTYDARHELVAAKAAADTKAPAIDSMASRSLPVAESKLAKAESSLNKVRMAAAAAGSERAQRELIDAESVVLQARNHVNTLRASA